MYKKKNDPLLHDQVTDEELMEALSEELKPEDEVDDEKAIPATVDSIKKSAPTKAEEPKASQKYKDTAEKPNLKHAMLEQLTDALQEMSEEELSELIDVISEAEDYDDEDDGEEKKMKFKPKGKADHDDEDDEVETKDFKEDLNALVSSEATLSEGFKEKANVIFEAAVNARVAEHVKSLEVEFDEQLNEAITQNYADIVESTDKYLDYVVETWVEENKLAVERGIRTEIAESFMSALHNVFAEHYVEVPEGKDDLLESLAEKVEQLEESLNKAVNKNHVFSNKVKSLMKENAIYEKSRSLTETQVEKLKSLVESVDFKTEEEFNHKVDTLIESYFNESTQRGGDLLLDDVNHDSGDTVQLNESSPMAKYLSALNK